MTTRAVYTFADNYGPEIHVYKYQDNYPEGEHGAIFAIFKALRLSWGLPRFEADEFAASFVAANKESEGGVRLLNCNRDGFPADIEYHYIVSQENGTLMVECREPGDESNKYSGKLIRRGSLAAMQDWALAGAPLKTDPARDKEPVSDMIKALRAVLNSDMAMAEEDEGNKSPVLDLVRDALRNAEGRA